MQGVSVILTSLFNISSVQSLSHVQLFATLWTTARHTSLSFTISWSLLRLMSVESAMASNHLVLCHPLILVPSIFPSTKVFSNESALHKRWPKYWSFSISPSKECLLGWVILKISISTKLFYNFKVVLIL